MTPRATADAMCHSSQLKPNEAAAEIPHSVTRPFSTRGFVSFLLVLCGLLMLVSGAVLYAAPRGRFANWTGWAVGGLTRTQWVGLHINVSWLFVAVALLHLTKNWSRLAGYLKRRAATGIHMKKELAAALAVAAAVLIGSTLDLPPFHAITGLRYVMRDSWEQPVATALQE